MDGRTELLRRGSDLLVVAVAAEVGAEAFGDGRHQALAVGCAVQAEDVAGEVQVLLHLPDPVVVLRRKDAHRVADGDPADRHHRVGG